MKVIACAALILLCGCSQETQGKTYDSKPVTATDQSNDPADIEITTRIRQSLVDANDLSMAAENVTVVSQKGIVTLRGTVATADEMRRIESIAQGVSGVQRVDNQIVVKSN